jgi:hypothetical protein
VNRTTSSEASHPVGDPEMLLGCLQELLERQLALVHQGSLDDALELCSQTDRYVRQIAEARAGSPACGRCPSEGASSADRRRCVEQLYRDLCLALTAQRAETSAALDTIRRGKRMLKTYAETGPFCR